MPTNNEYNRFEKDGNTDVEFKLCDDKIKESDFVERVIHIPIVAPLCYMRAYSLKKSNVIKLLDIYINSSKQLDNYNYFESLDTLFENEWVVEELENYKEEFANFILFNILKSNPEWLMASEKIDIKFHIPVTGVDKVDEHLLTIKIKNYPPIKVVISDNEKYQYFSENYIKYCMSNPSRFLNRLEQHKKFLESLDVEEE